MKTKKAIAVTIQQNQLWAIRLFGGVHLIRSIGKMVNVLRQDNDRIKHFLFFVFYTVTLGIRNYKTLKLITGKVVVFKLVISI